ncbi:hypothetical protein UFOVP270_14 [uncultured Caudovirales phage]|uniref:Uncharacterized protein n=1 Tax=uncultured Caudovirales phage TaxID=2100421 RepID=A0A6J5L4G3_9CAUD|nr:hypothetical protein UFOVP101_42 [uncultured Caudovirales phage]CAB4134081.1 hypothetical protein UFOVP270_14 [uncultured Caudovirales phage]
MDQETYIKLRDKMVQVSEIFLEYFNKIETKEQLIETQKSTFQPVFICFCNLVISLEYYRLNSEQAIKTKDYQVAANSAAELYLNKIEEKMISLNA